MYVPVPRRGPQRPATIGSVPATTARRAIGRPLVAFTHVDGWPPVLRAAHLGGARAKITLLYTSTDCPIMAHYDSPIQYAILPYMRERSAIFFVCIFKIWMGLPRVILVQYLAEVSKYISIFLSRTTTTCKYSVSPLKRNLLIITDHDEACFMYPSPKVVHNRA